MPSKIDFKWFPIIGIALCLPLHIAEEELLTSTDEELRKAAEETLKQLGVPDSEIEQAKEKK